LYCPTPTSNGRCSFVLPEEASFGQETQFYLTRGNHRKGDEVPSFPRPTLDRRCSFISPEAISGWETQFWLSRGQHRTGDAVPTRPRLISDGSAGTLHGPLDGPPDDLPSKACPRTAKMSST
jgi:hypothetical protein